MDTWIYCTELYCDDCACDIIREITVRDVRESQEDTGDSDDFPQGPYESEESDNPAHCERCGVFLENPLTNDGIDCLYESILEFLQTGHGNCVEEWIEFYGITLKDLIHNAYKNKGKNGSG